MTLNKGNSNIDDVKLGNAQVNKIYKGTQLMWEKVSVPNTTISPSSTTQSTIPFTVTLNATNSPTAIYYKLGATGTQQTYTAPFSVTQDSAGVNSAQIQVRYWSVNANGTEAEKSITYNTTSSQPTTPSPTIINGTNQVTLNWSPTLNTTSYSVYRSTVQGTLGNLLLPSEYQKATTYTDTTALGGTTYYYTVRSSNYTWFENSIQLTGQPIVGEQTPVTTISPASTIQNTIPFTVTLSATNNPTAIYYRLGAYGTQQTYSAPFPLSQDSEGVYDSNITVAYWSVNASGTETENTIIYDTNGSQPTVTSPTIINGENQVTINWSPTLNTTSYSVFRSQVQGTMGGVLLPSQYQTGTSYTDTTAIGGQTYYYTVRSANYSLVADSIQVTGLPTSVPSKPTFRYIRIDGYGEYFSGAGNTNTRMIEVEIFSGGTNRMAGKTGTTDDTVDFGTNVGATTLTRITDGVKGIGSTTYNGWWGATTNNGNAHVVFDLTTAYAIDSIRYWAYTSRSPRFIIWGSNNLADFGANGALGGGATKIWDMQTNDGLVVAGATAGTNNYIEEIF